MPVSLSEWRARVGTFLPRPPTTRAIDIIIWLLLLWLLQTKRASPDKGWEQYKHGSTSSRKRKRQGKTLTSSDVSSSTCLHLRLLTSPVIRIVVLVICLLLLRAGDVEINPGPNDGNQRPEIGISDKLLYNIAKSVPTEWVILFPLGFALNSSFNEIGRYIQMNDSHGTVTSRGTHAMLMDWKERTSITDQRCILRAALLEENLVNIADTFLPLESTPLEILAQGEAGIRAYEEALQNGKQEVYKIRVMLVGQERVGKTSLMGSLTGKEFDANEPSTQGIDTKNLCEINITEVHSKAKSGTWNLSKGQTKKFEDHLAHQLLEGTLSKAKTQIQSEGHSHETSTVHHPSTSAAKLGEYVRGSKITQRMRVLEARPWRKPQFHGSRRNPGIPRRIVDKMTMQSELKESLPDKEKCELAIWDFAGQDIYYTTHQVFLSWRAVYLLVFDLSKDLEAGIPLESQDDIYQQVKGKSQLDLTGLDFLHFWMSSIYTHAVQPVSDSADLGSDTDDMLCPTVILVGTHRESITGTRREKKEKIQKIKDTILNSMKGKKYEKHVHAIYDVENSRDGDTQVVSLCREVERIATNTRYWGEKIPITWLQFEEKAAEVRQEQYPYKDFDEVREMVRNLNKDVTWTDSGIRTMLTFYHDLGQIIYFGNDEQGSSMLPSIIIFSPQWLIDIFKRVIGSHKLAPRKKRPPPWFNTAWTDLIERGVLAERLMKIVWQEFISHTKDQNEFINFLIRLMKKFALICDAPRSVDKGTKGRHFLVPSRMTTKVPEERVTEMKENSSCKFDVRFETYLPTGLFNKYMCRVAQMKKENHGASVDLFYLHMIVPYDNSHNVSMEMKPPKEGKIEMTVYSIAVRDARYKPKRNKESDMDETVQRVMNFFEETFQNLCDDQARGIRFKLSRVYDTIQQTFPAAGEQGVVTTSAPPQLAPEPMTECYSSIAESGGIVHVVTPRGEVSAGIITKRVGASGDTLKLGVGDVQLEIPPGALGSEEDISLSAVDETPTIRNRNDLMVAITCRCTRTAPSKKFRIPVILTIPHCADLSDAKHVQPIMYIKHGQRWGRRRPIGDSGVPRCVIHERTFELHINHFTHINVGLEGEGVKLRMGCSAYMLQRLPPERQPLLHTYVYKKISDLNLEDLKRDERDSGKALILSDQEFLYNTRSASLKIECRQTSRDDPLGGEQIPRDKIKDLGKNVCIVMVDFNECKRNKNLSVSLEHPDSIEEPQTFPFQTQYSSSELSPDQVIDRVRDVQRSRRRTCVTPTQILYIAGNVSSSKYKHLATALGIPFNTYDNIWREKNQNTEDSLNHLLNEWKTRTRGHQSVLDKALEKAQCKSLIQKYKQK